MSLLHLLWRNMIYRKMLSLLTVFSVAVTVALIIFLELCSAGVEHGAEKKDTDLSNLSSAQKAAKRSCL